MAARSVGAEPINPQAIWQLCKETTTRWFEIGAPRFGAALAFYTVMSAAPLLVVSVGLAAMAFGRSAAEVEVIRQVQNLVGPKGAEVIQTLLVGAAQPKSGILATGVGLLLLLFGASGVFSELYEDLNTVWNAKPAFGGLVGIVKYRFRLFAMVLAVGFMLTVSLVLSTAIAATGKFFASLLPMPESVLHLTNFLLSFLTITLVFALLYKVIPDVQIEWRDVWTGAAVTSLLFSIGKFLIGLYLGKAGVGSVYGAAGSLVVLLMWVYYSSQIFMLGAEFTHTFAERHGSLARRGQRPVPPLSQPELA